MHKQLIRLVLGGLLLLGNLTWVVARAEDCGGISCRCMDCAPPLVTPQQRSRSEPDRQPDPPPEPPPRVLTPAQLEALAARQRLAVSQQQAVKSELARLASGFQRQRVQPSAELVPRGSNAFGLMADSGERPFGAIMVGSLSGIGTPASRIPLENLRRAAAILASFKPGQIEKMSEEDMSFLASQSALAMEGAPLSIVIRALPVGREEATRRLVHQAQEVETLQLAAARAVAERGQVEEKLLKVQQALQSGKGNAAALRQQREEVLQAYTAAYKNEASMRDKVREATRTVTEVWEQ